MSRVLPYALLASLLLPGAANADLGERVTRAGRTLGFVELLVPDLRLTLGEGRPKVALALPLVVGLGELWMGHAPGKGFRVCAGCTELGTALYLSVFLEPQWAPWDRSSLRGLFGFRALVHRDAWAPFALAVDAGGAGSARGPGGFAGAYVGAEVLGIALLAGGRRVVWPDGAAWEVVVDLQVPLQWLSTG